MHNLRAKSYLNFKILDILVIMLYNKFLLTYSEYEYFLAEELTDIEVIIQACTCTRGNSIDEGDIFNCNY